jgi:hypothetical protein
VYDYCWEWSLADGEIPGNGFHHLSLLKVVGRRLFLSSRARTFHRKSINLSNPALMKLASPPAFTPSRIAPSVVGDGGGGSARGGKPCLSNSEIAWSFTRSNRDQIPGQTVNIVRVGDYASRVQDTMNRVDVRALPMRR